ncbi:MAG: redoxin domain-containing protein [Acidobacteria bacterium]|nr:redoxin domain-containing protein [Acidobacteriota bacterium]
MVGLLALGFLAGVIAGISPCVLPILPVVVVGWVAPVNDTSDPLRVRRRRALAVVIGLVSSFALITALGSLILSSLGLPQDLLRNLGLVLLVAVGVGLLVPTWGQLLERPFRRLTRAPRAGTGSGFALGLGLGLVFVPCAGPVLSAVSTLGARHHASLFSVALSFVFAVGAATPMLAVALGGDHLIERHRALSRQARRYRPVAGVLLIVMALALGINAAAPLQRWLPAYTQTLQHLVERNAFATRQLHGLEYPHATQGTLGACVARASQSTVNGLQSCGPAPAFRGITHWLNTAGDRPLNWASLRGRVVLVDFWTYSCINCQRTLPHVEAWYAKYRRDGFDVVGVESPEFAFEHVLANIAGAAKSLGVAYPIAVDDNLHTWTAYQNNYWPAEYLVGANGVIRHVAYGEGDYGATESYIRSLLRQAHPSLRLPAPTDVANLTPKETTNPETYLGTAREQYMVGALAPSGTHAYTMPATIPLGSYGLAGAWRSASESITAVRGARLTLGFQARHVYLVLGGRGTVRVRRNGAYVRTIEVRGFPTLYNLLDQAHDTAGHLTLDVAPGVAAYDFTFG